MRSDAASLSDEEYLRYGRQLMLAEVGEEGQARLKGKSVLIVGLGGLGSPLALYLAGAGVGLSLIHISEPTRRYHTSRMPSSA